MGKIRTQLLATAALVALSGAAYAADMGMPLKAPPPPPPPVQDWSGVYVGLEGGYGWGKEDFNPAFNFFGPGELVVLDPPVNPTISSVNQSGGVFGGFAGVQKQWGSWVLGLEAEVDWADINGTTTATTTNSFHVLPAVTPAVALTPKTLTQTETEAINSKVDEVAYVGPKVGWAFSPNWMVYATGGAAWAHREDSASETFSQTCTSGTGIINMCTPFDTFTDTSGQSGGISMFGYAVGGGLDYKWQLDPGSAIILGVKYLHYGFGDHSLTLVDNQFTNAESVSFNTKQSLDIVTGRISWLFSIH